MTNAVKIRGRALALLLGALIATLALGAVASPASAFLRAGSFDGGAFDLAGDPVDVAGSHPNRAEASFDFETASVLVPPFPLPQTFPTEAFKDAIIDLPPGVVGNPQAVDTCTAAELQGGQPISVNNTVPGCSWESQVGVVTGSLGGIHGVPIPGKIYMGLYNMQRPKGTPALLGINYSGVLIFISARVILRDGEYTVRTTSKNASTFFALLGLRVRVWGVPADSSHDGERGAADFGNNGCLVSFAGPSGRLCPSEDAANPRPFFRLPTSCGAAIRTDLTAVSWQGGVGSDSFFSHVNGDPNNHIPIEGCPALGAGFNPSLQARPTTNVADSPTGLDVNLHLPQSDNPNGPGTADLREARVTLPEGLVINPSGANGLDGCSPAEVGMGTLVSPTCPPASRVASVSVETPLLDVPVGGSVYVADPFDNPFRSLLAIYLVIDDAETGIVVKLAGHVQPDPNTGQLTTTFADNPQVPFEDFNLRFFGGAGAQLKTPPNCGDHTTTSTLTPWSFPDSGAPVVSPDTWQIAQGPGGNCAQPHAPFFDAGTVSPIAGSHSPFVMNLRREDGSQQFSAVTLSPPQGLVAKLAGTEICPDSALAAAAAKSGNAEKASPSCPLTSEVGDVVAAAGAGPAPYYAPGKAYLAGPYKGAPLSLAIVTPATAGPFDLGTVVIKTALHVDPATAKITAVSDPIPQILDGIPLDVRSVRVSLDKPEFTLNPTSCDPMSVDGLLTSTLGQTAALARRFQVGECDRLGFKPRMALRLRGGTARGKHPQLTAYLLPRSGDANIRSVSVALPRSEFLENAHIRTICTRPDFAADRCPAGAVYGHSTVHTPLLDYPLTGNVYLRSSDNLLPDVVPDLRGPAWQPIKVEAAGRTDSIRGGIRNTFDFFPDAPFTRAILRMQGGDKGLLVNSRNICARTYRAFVRFTAHNGQRFVRRPKLVSRSCKNNKRRKAKRNGHKRGGKRVALSARASVR